MLDGPLRSNEESVTTKEHLSRHDREIAEIRAILKRTAEQHQREAAELWALLGKLATGTEAALRDLAAAQKRTEASLKALIDSRRTTNGHKKR
jgi:hypothetical protein